MSNIPFSPPSLLRLITASIPQNDEAHPQLKNAHDAIAIFTHACMLSVGFRLVGLSEEDRIEAHPGDESERKPLPIHWNAGNGSYGFRYSHTQSSMQYLVKISRLGGKTVVMGLGLGDDKTTSFDIVTSDYTSESFFPYATIDDQKKLENGFISEDRMVDLASLIKINIIQKLIPGLNKPGYEEERVRPDTTSSVHEQPRPDGDHDPLRVPRPYGDPHGGYPGGRLPPIPIGGEAMPGFDDEYEVLQPPRGYGFPPGGRNPLSIGADDLNPPGLGPNPPLRGPFFGEGGGMGGMHPTPDHPMFGGRGGRMIGNPRAPPGSRYDPVGPGDEPPMGGGLRGPRGPGPGGPYNPFSNFGSGDFM